MRQAKVELYAHLVWTTKDRLALIGGEVRRPLYRCLESQAQHLRCTVLALNGTADHVHMLVRTPATLAVAPLVKQLKGVSSKFVHDQLGVSLFSWQEGYGAFSVSKGHCKSVMEYVAGQEEHHRTGKVWERFEETYEEVDE